MFNTDAFLALEENGREKVLSSAIKMVQEDVITGLTEMGHTYHRNMHVIGIGRSIVPMCTRVYNSVMFENDRPNLLALLPVLERLSENDDRIEDAKWIVFSRYGTPMLCIRNVHVLNKESPQMCIHVEINALRKSLQTEYNNTYRDTFVKNALWAVPILLACVMAI